MIAIHYVRLLAVLAAIVLSWVALETSALCDRLWKHTATGTQKECDSIPDTTYSGLKYPNLPTIGGAYCFNNGSGICKAFAGRFEFYFNVFTDKAIGPAPASEYVDSYGYHKRVPVSYDTKGEILYADRSLNWAKKFSSDHLKGKKISLLSINDFNWCAFTENGWWPYKSSIVDAKSNGRYHIFFHNRQSCIFDTKTKKRQHYNTRFLHNSSLRIDLDMNPTIFAMEDPLAKEIRLVKHKRQHWYEVQYQVVEKPTPDITYFVLMGDTEKKPCKIDGSNGPILSKRAYSNFSNICLTDQYTQRDDKNTKVLQPYCGLEEVEIADYTYPQFKQDPGRVIEVDLHNLPRGPKTLENFYGLKIDTTEDWLVFAKDGFTFSATTTIPIANSTDEVRVISLYADFKVAGPQNEYDEYYPLPFLADYIAKYKKTSSGMDWEFDRAKSAKPLKNLNYVDDIAYLHKCQTILVIFGPLFTELPVDKFALETKASVDSIANLGIFEMVNAFFAIPESNSLYVYHRMNYIVEIKYSCGQNGVQGTGRAGRYMPRRGVDAPKWIINDDITLNINHFEETFFQKVGLFKGSIGSPEAPDPSAFPIGTIGAPQPLADSDNLMVYIIVLIGVILIVAMCITCMITFRRRRRERMGGMGPAPTTRSALSSHGVSNVSSARSALHSNQSDGVSKMGAHPTARSGLAKSKSSKLPKSKRSKLESSKIRQSTASAGTVRSASHGSAHSSSSIRRAPTHRSALRSKSMSPVKTSPTADSSSLTNSQGRSLSSGSKKR